MANEANLKPVRTESEARTLGANGGRKSGEARREKKLLRECLEILLENIMEGENGEEMTGAEALAAAIFGRALMGDIRAAEFIRDTCGQKCATRLEVGGVDPLVIAEVEEMVRMTAEERKNNE